MVKETITYKDFNDEERTESFYFNLTQAEITEWSLSVDGGLEEHLQNIVEKRNGAEIIRSFKTLLEKAYGEKSPDGKRFVKNPDAFKQFSETRAYDQLFMRLVTDSAYAAKFIEQIMDDGFKGSSK